MQIQVALDRLPLDLATAIARDVADLVDVVEIGTSLVKQYGAVGIAAVVDAVGTTPVLADLKTADDAAFEFGMAYDAGARSATVLGLAQRETIELAIDVAAQRGCEVVIDLMGVDASTRAALLEWVPGSPVLAAHVGKDAQARGSDARHLLGPWVTGRRVALAGGLVPEDMAGLSAHTDLRVVAGSAVTRSPEPRAVVARIVEALRAPSHT